MVLGLAGLMLSRILQLWGLIILYRWKKWEAIFCLLVIGYFLLISGPVGYAKYRLPFEPILIVLMAIGIKDIYRLLIKKKESSSMEEREQEAAVLQ
ncbi:MAG: hypothetical protein JRF57_15920 [Deltaproteobacteria bacterium]|nr:hypothetical protein [Deltaproteobacteria bacterium]